MVVCVKVVAKAQVQPRSREGEEVWQVKANCFCMGEACHAVMQQMPGGYWQLSNWRKVV